MNDLREHEAYAHPVGGGWDGYQGRCHDCEWRAPVVHPRGSKPMAQRDAQAHRWAADPIPDEGEE